MASPLVIGALAIAGAGTILNAIIQNKALKEGRKEARRTEAINLELYEREEKARKKERAEDIARERRYRREDVGFREKQFEEEKKARQEDVGYRGERFEFEKGEAARVGALEERAMTLKESEVGRIAGLEERAMTLQEQGFENEKEMQNFNKGLSFVDRMLSQLNSKPALASNLIQLSRGRA